MGAFYGNADNGIVVYGNYLEYNKQVHQKLGLDIKLTTLAQNGNGLSAFGIADVFVNTNYKATKKFKITFGAKIPLSNANNKKQDLPLPMDYQASLGTFDLIIGTTYEIKKFQFVAAVQQPLTQNENQFIASKYPSNSNLSSFQSTNKFQRSGDVLLRISYLVPVHSKLKLTPSLLSIYHLVNDKYIDEFGIKKEITGSEGLTLNSNVFLDYSINNKNTIQINGGMPFIVRASRPDGLTRSFIANIEYSFKF
jgi:hypothetical protein